MVTYSRGSNDELVLVSSEWSLRLMASHNKTDAQLVACNCRECRDELLYREHFDRFPNSKATPELIAEGNAEDRGWRPFGLNPKDVPLSLLQVAAENKCPTIEEALNESHLYE